MRKAGLAIAACLLAVFGAQVSSSPAAASAATNLMGRIPSVAELSRR